MDAIGIAMERALVPMRIPQRPLRLKITYSMYWLKSRFLIK